MALRGKVNRLRDLAKTFRQLPKVVGHKIASAVTPELTAQLRDSYSGGRTVYNDIRPAGVNGPLTLVATGTTAATMLFSSVGTKVRTVLGTPYAKYLIGKYRVLPMGAIPIDWTASIDEIARQVIPKELG